MLVERRIFKGDLISKRVLIEDNFDQLAADKEDVWLYTKWLDMIQGDRGIDSKWRTWTVFRDEVTELQGYEPFEKELDPTYYGSEVMSSQTCVWCEALEEPRRLTYLQVGATLYDSVAQYAALHKMHISMAEYLIDIGRETTTPDGLPFNGRRLPTPSLLLVREEL